MKRLGCSKRLMLGNGERPNYVTVLSVIRAVGALDIYDWEDMLLVVHDQNGVRVRSVSASGSTWLLFYV
jgi:hypothetical protein